MQVIYVKGGVKPGHEALGKALGEGISKGYFDEWNKPENQMERQRRKVEAAAAEQKKLEDTMNQIEAAMIQNKSELTPWIEMESQPQKPEAEMTEAEKAQQRFEERYWPVKKREIEQRGEELTAERQATEEALAEATKDAQIQQQKTIDLAKMHLKEKPQYYYNTVQDRIAAYTPTEISFLPRSEQVGLTSLGSYEKMQNQPTVAIQDGKLIGVSRTYSNNPKDFGIDPSGPTENIQYLPMDLFSNMQAHELRRLGITKEIMGIKAAVMKAGQTWDEKAEQDVKKMLMKANAKRDDEVSRLMVPILRNDPTTKTEGDRQKKAGLVLEIAKKRGLYQDLVDVTNDDYIKAQSYYATETPSQFERLFSKKVSPKKVSDYFKLAVNSLRSALIRDLSGDTKAIPISMNPEDWEKNKALTAEEKILFQQMSWKELIDLGKAHGWDHTSEFETNPDAFISKNPVKFIKQALDQKNRQDSAQTGQAAVSPETTFDVGTSVGKLSSPDTANEGANEIYTYLFAVYQRTKDIFEVNKEYDKMNILPGDRKKARLLKYNILSTFPEYHKIADKAYVGK